MLVLWAPYARSVPESTANQIASYFPGKKYVDLTGASSYNFGAVRGLTWLEPAALFQGVYGTAQALAPGKKFWIAETASTAAGGNKAAWIAALGTLNLQLPNLAGIVWYDVKEPDGRLPRRTERGHPDRVQEPRHEAEQGVPLMAKARVKKPAQPTLRVGKPRRHRLQVPPPVETAGQVPERLTPNMTDRLFWRAGFGPSAADRANWTGKLVTRGRRRAARDARGGAGRPRADA